MTRDQGGVLVVGAQGPMLERLTEALAELIPGTVCAESVDAARALLGERRLDAVVASARLPHDEVLSLGGEVGGQGPRPVFVVLLPVVEASLVTRFEEAGADEVIEESTSVDVLVALLDARIMGGSPARGS